MKNSFHKIERFYYIEDTVGYNKNKLDKKLVEKLREDQIPLTVCPLSNIKLCVFDKLEKHNLKKMLNKELLVMINSDDPAYFGGYVNKNLIESQIALELSMKEIKTLIANSFKSSFLKEQKKPEWINKH